MALGNNESIRYPQQVKVNSTVTAHAVTVNC